MACHPIRFYDGTTAIVCDRSRRKTPRCECGQPADRLCDWRALDRSGKTCSKPVCSRCSTRPAPDKDLCTKHGFEFVEWQRQRDDQPRLAL